MPGHNLKEIVPMKKNFCVHKLWNRGKLGLVLNPRDVSEERDISLGFIFFKIRLQFKDLKAVTSQK